jgi:hypothetical protein
MHFQEVEVRWRHDMHHFVDVHISRCGFIVTLTQRLDCGYCASTSSVNSIIVVA